MTKPRIATTLHSHGRLVAVLTVLALTCGLISALQGTGQVDTGSHIAATWNMPYGLSRWMDAYTWPAPMTWSPSRKFPEAFPRP